MRTAAALRDYCWPSKGKCFYFPLHHGHSSGLEEGFWFQRQSLAQLQEVHSPLSSVNGAHWRPAAHSLQNMKEGPIPLELPTSFLHAPPFSHCGFRQLTYILKQQLSTKCGLLPRGHLTTSGDVLVATTRKRGLACYWHLQVEARDAAKYPTMHRAVPTNKPKISNYLAQNVNHTKGEKMCFKGLHIFFLRQAFYFITYYKSLLFKLSTSRHLCIYYKLKWIIQ